MKVILVLAALLATTSTDIIYENVVINLENLNEIQSKVPRIVNGQAAAENQFPHQALVYINKLRGTSQCGGTLISDSWVLCAAHCIVNAKAAMVLLGSTNRNSMPVQRKVIEINRMSSFNSRTLQSDIALLKLNETVDFTDNVKPINLPSLSQVSASYTRTVLIVSGFGLDESLKVTEKLQFTTVVGISISECNNFYAGTLPQAVICTRGYPRKNQASCNGDSGGPLITRGDDPVIVGIVSFGMTGSCSAGLPEVYTRVASYLGWISKTTGIKLRR